MTFHRKTRIALLFAIVAAATALSNRPSLAFSPDAQQMCTGDAMRLCGHEVPDVQRITACMVKQRAHLSPGCRAVMERDHAARRRAAATE